ncbi:MAG: hemerythrin domain-containing protein [Cryobacterium sp.]|nr:hemerythrin domain-containing protein [Oligoflexia bacterium]
MKKNAKTQSKKKAAKSVRKAAGPVEGIKKAVSRVSHLFQDEPQDIADAIKQDHEALRNFLKLLKDTDEPMAKRRQAYSLFSDLLKSHSKIEESVVYAASDVYPGRELHIKIAEGYVEHQLATDLMNRIEKAKDAVTWSAHANVLSEIVEHHLKEEERDLLPLIRKAAKLDADQAMLHAFIAGRERTQVRVEKKNAGVLK